MLYIYHLILWLISPLVLGYTLAHATKDEGKRYVQQRFGLGLPHLKKPIWLHCASIGEVIAARPLFDLITQKHPNTPIVVTTNTKSGHDVLVKIKNSELYHVYLPLDFNVCIERFLNHINPRCALILETELWPNLFYGCHRRTIPLIIVNGRLTHRTLNAPALIRRIYRFALSHTRVILARSDEDKARFLSLGANPNQVITLGNIKFAPPPDSKKKKAANPVVKPYWLAASTHEDEELRLARGWKKIGRSDVLLVIAPRHAERRDSILKQLKNLQLTVMVRSQGEPITQHTQVYLADTVGEMPAFMAHADFVFLGGSLINRGGQNILEPARLGKAIIVGPHMDNFAEETATLLANKAMVMVQDDAHLYERIIELIENPSLRDELGNNAKRVIEKRSDIVRIYYEKLQSLGAFGE